MKRLRKRVRADTHMSEARRPRPRTWDRNVYLAMLVVFFGALVNYVAGDRVFLRADGLVMLERTVIGASEMVRVTEIGVQPGQHVSEGQMLVRAESLDTIARLAELAMREAEMAERSARLRSDLVVATSLQPLADQRMQELSERRDTMARLENSRLLTAQSREDVRELVHGANLRATTLAAQIQGLTAEIAALDQTRVQARSAIQDLESRYHGGVHTATRAGTVGDAVPARGQVFSPGDPILTIYWGEPYVLAYLPPGYLFDLRVGEQVQVSAGKLTRPGRIDAILPMSTPVPDEFYNAFRLRETRQLARIALDPGPDLPAMATVRVTTRWLRPIRQMVANGAASLGIGS